MPKKSNKTAHVLSLLTNGGGELSSENESIVVTKPNITANENIPTLAPEVVVEVKGADLTDSLSDLVKADLERELSKEQLSANQTKPSSEDSSSPSERPPYSPTFMAKFGIDSASKESPTDKQDVGECTEQETPPVSLEQVKSEVYVLEDFNDEEENVPMDENTISTPPIGENTESTKVLHNIVEDVMKLRVPEVMKSLNMCYCSDCVYDVMALALNHMQPLYTVTEKGQLYQKLNSYETQYGTDLTSQITKACLKVKLNPNHHTPIVK